MVEKDGVGPRSVRPAENGQHERGGNVIGCAKARERSARYT
jgi:hypothetical protein